MRECLAPTSRATEVVIGVRHRSAPLFSAVAADIAMAVRDLRDAIRGWRAVNRTSPLVTPCRARTSQYRRHAVDTTGWPEMSEPDGLSGRASM
jgi:hypothetical protein